MSRDDLSAILFAEDRQTPFEALMGERSCFDLAPQARIDALYAFVQNAIPFGDQGAEGRSRRRLYRSPMRHWMTMWFKAFRSGRPKPLPDLDHTQMGEAFAA